MNTNIGYLFYKDYFSSLKINITNGVATFDGENAYRKLKNIELDNYTSVFNFFKNDFIQDDKPLKLTTTYPGLLIGSGYIHDIGSKEKDPNNKKEFLVKNELRLGFFFDHTTGLPIIPASSVKGLLRSAFKKVKGDYVAELLNSITETEIWNKEKVQKLEKSIFENSDKVSIYQRDVFFDAFPIESETNNLFSNDYITPHKEALKNPNPIQFLKIVPQVQFQFNFKLEDYKTEEIELKKEKKQELFKLILLDLGIGAKTNVGYGQFEYIRPPIIRLEENITNEHRESLMYDANNQQNNLFTATVCNKNENDYLFEIKSLDQCRIRKSIANINKKFTNDAQKRIKRNKNGTYKILEIGDEVNIRLNRPTGTGLNFTVLPIWI